MREPWTWRPWLWTMAATLLVVWSSCSLIENALVRGPFPREIGVERVVAISSESGWREGCLAVLLKLRRRTVVRLDENGVEWLGSLRTGRDGTELSAWAPGPLATREGARLTIDGGFLHVGLMADCSSSADRPAIDRATIRAIEDALARGEAYYATYNDGEGLLIVCPELGLAGSFYLG